MLLGKIGAKIGTTSSSFDRNGEVMQINSKVLVYKVLNCIILYICSFPTWL